MTEARLAFDDPPSSPAADGLPPGSPLRGARCTSCSAPWQYLGGKLQVGHVHRGGCTNAVPIVEDELGQLLAGGVCLGCGALGRHYVRGGAPGGALRLFCDACDQPGRRTEATNEWLRLGGAGDAARARVVLLEVGFYEIATLAAERRPRYHAGQLFLLLEQIDRLARLFGAGPDGAER